MDLGRGAPVSIFASADEKVVAQYALLERALRPGLASEHNIDDKARDYALHVLSQLASGVPLPSDGSEIDEERAHDLLERFLEAVTVDHGSRKNLRTLSAGDVAFNFSCLVYYALGQSTRMPTRLQRDILLEACDIAETRPLPVIRWTEFVRSNVSDAARVRTVMRSCIYSKTLLSLRLSSVVADLSEHLALPQTVRILAIGSSGTVRDALQGLKRVRNVDVFSTHPTQGIALDPKDLGFDVVPIEDSDAVAGHVKFDLVVIGCAVIGKTNENEIEVVNWARDISVAKRIRKQQVPVIIIGGLYKIWPQSFYQSHKDFAVDMRKEASAGADAILTKDDIDWLITEHEAVSFREPARPRWVQFLLEAQSLDVTASLSLCADPKKKAFIQSILENKNLQEIDSALGQLSTDERPLFDRYPRHDEDYEYIRTGKLPAQFLAAQDYYDKMIRNPEWRRRHNGKFVAILGTDFQTIAEPDLEGVLHKAYSRWGYRPIFYSSVDDIERGERLLPTPEPLDQ
jgi:hypothetical protein